MEVAVHVPASRYSPSSAGAIKEVQNLLTGYLSACKTQDRQGILYSLTADAEIEYAVDALGHYLAVDLNTVDACWGAVQSIDSATTAADVWIYLTGSPDVVFVEMVTQRGVGLNAEKSEHLAMVKMSAGRIAQIRDFTTSQAPGVLTVNESDPEYLR